MGDKRYIRKPAVFTSNKERKERIRKEQLENEAFNTKRREENVKIHFDQENQFHNEMRTVLLIINGYQKYYAPDKPGYYRYIIIDVKTDKYVKVDPSPYKSGIHPIGQWLRDLLML
ncbi:hypothetical protein GC102_19230 [Paenibacillus sp. LMG 31460]|uniref:Uncharacterized protein n=1 Tax=Paenibacillus germinis TaxID=2654979 RepID=A0ABX1Z6H9_9BACL|nr:hypothetical protein [Paenibacillus germinis]NOU87889.1 hypothetical protein [Paenibacillus germinis]